MLGSRTHCIQLRQQLSISTTNTGARNARQFDCESHLVQLSVIHKQDAMDFVCVFLQILTASERVRVCVCVRVFCNLNFENKLQLDSPEFVISHRQSPASSHLISLFATQRNATNITYTWKLLYYHHSTRRILFIKMSVDLLCVLLHRLFHISPIASCELSWVELSCRSTTCTNHLEILTTTHNNLKI